jgi:hypothetical protein
MKPKIIAVIIFILVSINICAQEFNDTIISNNSDTIFCKITLVNNYNIFYSYNPKKKKIVETFIPRGDVKYFTVQDKSINIQEEETPPEYVKSNYAENNGIIYPAFVSTPPIYLSGQNDLHAYIEEYVRVYPRDWKVFQDYPAVILYEVTIDSIGKVTDVVVYESSAQTGGFHNDCRYLENEIRTVIESMNNWTPATLDEKKIPITFYIPIKLRLDGSSIVILPAKFLFPFKERE